MKIKLAILSKDVSYLNRLVAAFGNRYADNFEMYSFTDMDVALKTLEPAKIDVLIADNAFSVPTEELPKRCGFAYFVDSPDIESLNGQQAIFRFQRAELIYKQVLGIFSEKASNVTGLKLDDGSCRVVIFASPCGGTGCSSAAAACAIRYASQNKKTLYLSLERFGGSDCFFRADGQFNMSDLIFALKSKHQNLALKMESYIRRDASGVYFFSLSNIALDMIELTSDDIQTLLSQARMTGGYDYVIVDMEFSLEPAYLNIYRAAHAMVITSDGSEVANLKLSRALEAISTLESTADSPLTRRISLFYNKFSNKTCRQLENTEVTCIGGSPRYERAQTRMVVDHLASLNCFDDIFRKYEALNV